MNKKLTFMTFLFVIMSTAWAGNDELANKIYSFCQTSGGKITYTPTTTIYSAARVCVTSTCSIDKLDRVHECNVNIDTQVIPAGCGRAVLETCGTLAVSSGSNSGSSSGLNSGSNSG